MGLIALAFAPVMAVSDQSESRDLIAQAGRLSAGFLHSCVVVNNGGISCWGEDGDGQLGDGGTADRSSPVPVVLPTGRTATALSAGIDHTCAVLDNGDAYCWGFGSNGELGDGNGTGSLTPVRVAVPAGRTVTRIVTSVSHGCAILDDASAHCWGANGNGRLGDGTSTQRLSPVRVELPVGRTAAAITTGDAHSCAVLDDGDAYCWGANGGGRLGDGTDTASPLPVRVTLPGGRTARAITTGGNFSCAVLDDGAVWCWGINEYGQIGDGTTTDRWTPVPATLPTGRTAMAVSAGDAHACAVLDDGAVVCWGINDAGQLGDGTTTDRWTPVPATLPTGRTAVAVTAGGSHTCATLDDGSVRCWGANGRGQLGTGDTVGTGDPATVAPALAARSTPARTADLRVTVTQAPSALTGGEFTTITFTVTNAGPDAASGVRVSVTPTLMRLVDATPTRGTVSGWDWQVGTLASGASASLSLAVNAGGAGTAELTAELVAADQFDPDSTPGNHAAAEDDQASARIPVTEAPLVAAPQPEQQAPQGSATTPRLSGTTLTTRVRALTADGTLTILVRTPAGARIPMRPGTRIGGRVLGRTISAARMASPLAPTRLILRFAIRPPRGSTLELILNRPGVPLAHLTGAPIPLT